MRGVLLSVVAVAAVWGVLHVGWYAHRQIVDYGIYQRYGDKVVDEHAVPYRDFDLEYPPGALPMFVLPSLAPHSQYQHVFQILGALCLAAAVLAAYSIAGSRAAALTALGPLALGSVVLSRFDLWPTALVALALAAALRRRPTLSAVLVGVAFAAKLWPAVLVPLLVLWFYRSEGRREAMRWLAVAAATAAAVFVPFVALSPGGVAHSFHSQLARPLQIESLGAAVLIALHHTVGSTLYVVSGYGGQNVAGTGSHAVAVATTVVGGTALLLAYAAFGRTEASDDDLLRFCAGVVAVTLAFGKVFSPQFLIWLIPLVPLVRGVRAAVVVPTFFSTLVLTQLWFPERYWQLATNFAPTQSWELFARDVLVVALAVVLLWPERLQHQVLGEHRSRVEALQRVRPQVE
jgi:uncharacterized membrane protein